MATKRFVAKQVRRAEVQHLTVTAVAVGGVLGLTVNGKTVQYVCVTGDTTATAAAGLVAAVQAADDPEFKLFSSAVDDTATSQINLTSLDTTAFLSADGNTAFTVSGSGGATITSAIGTAGKSPCDLSDVVNWGGALPADLGDSWYFEDAPYPGQWNAAALAAKTPDAITVLDTFSGAGVGLPKFAATGFEEYRGGRLAVVGCAALTVRQPAQAGAAAFRFDVGSGGGCVLKVIGNGQPPQVGLEVVDWVGTGAGNTAEVVGGSLTVAPYVSDAAALDSLKVVNGVASVGPGATLTTLESQGGTVLLQVGCTTFTQDGDEAQAVIRGAGAITTLTVEGGTVYHNGTGTVGTLTVGTDATIDFSGLDEPITITNKVLLHKGATFWDPLGRVTLTAGWQTVHCTAAEVTTNLGVNRSYAVS